MLGVYIGSRLENIGSIDRVFIFIFIRRQAVNGHNPSIPAFQTSTSYGCTSGPVLRLHSLMINASCFHKVCIDESILDLWEVGRLPIVSRHSLHRGE